MPTGHLISAKPRKASDSDPDCTDESVDAANDTVFGRVQKLGQAFPHKIRDYNATL